MAVCPMGPLAILGLTVYGLSVVLPLISLWQYLLGLLVVCTTWFLLADADLPTLYAGFRGIRTEHVRGQVVWIVGASTGIGAELARIYTQQGAQVIISARREEELRKVAASCKGEHPPFVLPLDVSRVSSHSSALHTLLTKFHKLDVVVLNAGRTQRSLAEDTEIEVTREMMELNFTSLVALTRQVLPTFFEQGGGQFVVTSSVSGKMGAPVSSSYSATKFALQGYFDALRLEVADRGIQVFLACPGPVGTSIEASAFTHKAGEMKGSIEEDINKKMSVGRCAYLMVAAASRGLDESWISKQPVLLFTALTNYFPDLARFIGKKTFGPMRVRAFRNGADVYSFKNMIFGSNNHKKE